MLFHDPRRRLCPGTRANHHRQPRGELRRIEPHHRGNRRRAKIEAYRRCRARSEGREVRIITMATGRSATASSCAPIAGKPCRLAYRWDSGGGTLVFDTTAADVGLPG